MDVLVLVVLVLVVLVLVVLKTKQPAPGLDRGGLLQL
jgi:hypothetical protein